MAKGVAPFDGAVDHRGEALPVLSKSSANMKMEKLVNTPMPSFDKETPGSPFWTKLAFFFCRRTAANQFRTIEYSGMENIPTDRGSLCAAWHTNGLIDPLGIMLAHPKEFVMGGRHDLVTRPVLSFWTRRLAVQPVVRKAELLRGGCSEEEATNLNGRSLLTLATGISSGFACVLFPEGTSHDLSHMLRFRTGPMRTVLAAAAIAKGAGKKCPVMQPVGLHFRVRHHYRTDMWVEFTEPYYLPEDKIPVELIEAVQKREWVEPPGDLVRSLRDGLRPHLAPITPNVSSWDEHGAYHLIAQLESRMNKKPLSTWRSEVLSARAVRDRFQTEPQGDDGKPVAVQHPLVDAAKDIHLHLQERNLDGRDLDASGHKLRIGSPVRGVGFAVKTALMAIFLPAFLLSLTPQLALGRFLGDRTDEGVDARTTYQFLTAMFGSVLLWPIFALIGAGLIWWNSNDVSALTSIDVVTIFGNDQASQIGAFVILYLAMFPLFWTSGRMFGFWWDGYVDARRAFSRLLANKSYKQSLELKLKELTSELNASNER
jgi:1-acyl-sn-glycerol-3-phosphate acyltransferase